MLPKHGMIYVDDLKKATLAEFDKVEADWRETAERQYGYLADYEHVPTPEETEAVDDCDPVYVIESHVASVKEFANNWIADTIRWGELATARVEARAKAKRKTKRKETA